MRVGTATHRGSVSGLAVAVSHQGWPGSSLCQAYVEIRGDKGSVVAKVDTGRPAVAGDACHLDPGHLDLGDEAFAAIGELSLGHVPVSWRVLPNPPIAGDIVITVLDGSDADYVRVAIDNTGNAIARVEIAAERGDFVQARRRAGGWFGLAGAGWGPLRVRITDVHGQQAVAGGILLDAGIPQHTGVRLYD